MRFSVTVKPRSKKPGIARNSDGSLIVRVAEPAVDNKANAAVIAALADYFAVRKNQINIVSGTASRKKIIEVS